MDPYEELISWAIDHGIELIGIKPLEIPGRGTGVVATRDIKAGEILLVVPTKVFRSLDQVPKAISQMLPSQITLHALLAAFLALDDNEKFATSHAIFPSLSAFETSIPLMWPSEMHVFLPKPAKDLLINQQHSFERDWAIVSKTYPDIDHAQYLHAWLLVSTRSFYFTTPRMNQLPHDDRLALLPIADLFNHADDGCEAVSSQEGYKFIADRLYHAGEEIYTCYGSHSNDFLLTEYGFVLSENRWDVICLDDAIFPRLTNQQKDILRDKGFLGKYLLSLEDGCCFRTQVALRMLCWSYKGWLQFVDDEAEVKTSSGVVNALLLQILKDYLDTIHQILEDIENLSVGGMDQRELLLMRWKQIQIIVSQTMKHLGS